MFEVMYCREVYKVYHIKHGEYSRTCFLIYDSSRGEWLWLNAQDCVPVD